MSPERGYALKLVLGRQKRQPADLLAGIDHGVGQGVGSTGSPAGSYTTIPLDLPDNLSHGCEATPVCFDQAAQRLTAQPRLEVTV
jgi:hypothetical protein